MTGCEISRIEDRERVAAIRLPGKGRSNALGRAAIDALETALHRVGDDESLRAIILCAEGRAFSAGHDLEELAADPSGEEARELFLRCGRVMEKLADLPQVVVAQVQGVAAAAGCQLVAACDLAVASEEARFATSGINLGLFCAGPAVPLTRNIPLKHAAELLFTGEFIGAERARELGLVNRVAAADALERDTLALVDAIAAKPAEALRAGKRMLRRQLELSLDEAYRLAADTMAENLEAGSAREGIAAFLEKREPNWK